MTAKLAEALAKAQAEMKAAPLNKVNPHFRSKYADLPAVIDAVRPALTKHGLSVTQTTRITEGGGLILVTTLHHTSGETLSGEYPLPVGKPQEMGSAITYARRYSLSALCCIAADEDDDANAAEGAGQTASKPNPAAKAPPPVEPLDVTAPKVIRIMTAADTDLPDWIGWGQLFTATIRACRTAEQLDAWLKLHEPILKNMRENAPEKLAKRVDAVIADCLQNAPAAQEAA